MSAESVHLSANATYQELAGKNSASDAALVR